MVQILVNPDRLRALAADLQQFAQAISQTSNRLGISLNHSDLEFAQRDHLDQQIGAAVAQGRRLGEQATMLAAYLLRKAEAFETADAQGVTDLDKVFKETPLPVPVPAPTPSGSGSDGVPPQVVIDQLKTLLQPVDWADTLGAEKQFRRTMEEIGRLLNHAGHTIGNIKLADEVTSFLLGANKVLGAIGNLLTLNDYRRFLSGELTNQEAARAAISSLLGPAALVPGLGPEIVEWYAKNVPNPNGHWHGFVAPVE